MTVPDWVKALGASALPHFGGFAGAYLSAGASKDIWYDRQLKKPSWRPPNWVFGPVWSCLYTGMGYASYLVYRDGGGFANEKTKIALAVYAGHLALNWAFTPIFFHYKQVGLATADIAATAVAAAGTAYLFHDINPTAGHLMYPYLAWLSFAFCVSFSIWRLNRKPEDKTE